MSVPLFNRENALQRLRGNEALFASLVAFFLEDAPGLVARVRQGVETNQLDDLRLAAHSLKGLAANFDGLPAMQLALRLEEVPAGTSPEQLRAMTDELDAAIAQLCRALEPFRPAE